MYGPPQSRLCTSQQITGETTEQAWNERITWTMEARHATDTIHTSSGQFRSQIHQQRRCTPPATSTRRALQNNNGLGRTKVHRNHARLGLQAKKSTLIDARIHQGGTIAICNSSKNYVKSDSRPSNQPIQYGAKTQYAIRDATNS